MWMDRPSLVLHFIYFTENRYRLTVTIQMQVEADRNILSYPLLYSFRPSQRNSFLLAVFVTTIELIMIIKL
jgi:hypothetical protein